MEKATNMNDSIQSINSLSLQPQVTKLQQEQPCDFAVPQHQALWTMTQFILAGINRKCTKRTLSRLLVVALRMYLTLHLLLFEQSM